MPTLCFRAGAEPEGGGSAGSNGISATSAAVWLVPAIQVSEQWLKNRDDAGGSHHSHTDERHFLKDDAVPAVRVAGHVLRHVGDVQRIGLGHRVGRLQLRFECSRSA